MTASDATLDLVIESVSVETGPEPAIILTGACRGATPTAVSLVGTRQRLAARLEVDAGTWRAVIPLLVARWGSAPLPPRSDRYRLEAVAGHHPSAAPHPGGVHGRVPRLPGHPARGVLRAAE